jgi:hypothetical protein
MDHAQDQENVHVEDDSSANVFGEFGIDVSYLHRKYIYMRNLNKTIVQLKCDFV